MANHPQSDQQVIYAFDDYKVFLSAVFTTAGESRGKRAALARHLNCQPAFISQVLNGATHLSLEQAFRVGQFLGMDGMETEFLLLLVQQDRAGTGELRQFFRRQILDIRRTRAQVRDRLRIKSELEGEDRVVYYSSWHYAAIHVMTSIPKYQRPEAIAARLNLSRGAVSKYLHFLVQAKLVVNEDGLYRISSRRIHLGQDSALVARHHCNWRLQSLLSFDRTSDDALHYSSVVSLAKSDAERIKDLFLDALATTERILEASPEEEVFCLSLDLFELGGT